MKRILVALCMVAFMAGSANASFTIFSETFSASGGTAYDQAPTTTFAAGWGSASTQTIAAGSLNMDIGSNNGSAGILWRVDLYAAGLSNGDDLSLDATWNGTAVSGWAEGMFWQTNDASNGTAHTVFDTGNSGGGAGSGIAVKHDGFGLPNPTWGSIAWSGESGANVVGSPLNTTVTSQYAWIALKVGNSANFNVDNISLTSTVPEPSTIALLGIGAVGMFVMGKRRFVRK